MRRVFPIANIEAGMKTVAMVSDITDGGAAIACRRLAGAIKSRGVWTVRWLAGTGDPRTGAEVVSAWPPFFSLLRFRLAWRLGGARVRNRAWATLHNAAMAAAVRRQMPSVIHLHNIHHGLSFDLVRRLLRKVPIVWTLHDMETLTGSCFHSGSCRAFTDGCRQKCPSDALLNLSAGPPSKEWSCREAFYRKSRERLVWVAPSQWMYDQARARFADSMRVELIHHGIPSDIFRPCPDRAAVRAALGLGNCSGPVLMAAAHSFSSEFKGADVLIRLMAILAERMPNAVLVILGDWPPEKKPAAGCCVYAGRIVEERLLNLYYNAADLFVHASRFDTAPLVLLEAAAAGLPAVAFAVGGCAEMVQDGKTGFLASEISASALAMAVERFLALAAPAREAMRSACRERVERQFSPAIQAARHEALFEDLVARKQNNARSG